MSLPFLPGRTPKDLSVRAEPVLHALSTLSCLHCTRVLQKTTFHKSSAFNYVNGIPVAKKTVAALSQEEEEALVNAQPAFTQRPPTVLYPPVIPAHVAFDKKVRICNSFSPFFRVSH